MKDDAGAAGGPGPDHPAGEIRMPSVRGAATRLYLLAGVMLTTAVPFGENTSVLGTTPLTSGTVGPTVGSPPAM